VPSYDVNLVDLHLALQLHRRRLGDQPAAQLLRHGLHIRDGQAQLTRNLPVRQVQAHEVEAQHPHPQRPVMPGQHHRAAIPRWEMPRSGIKAGEVVETGCARLAPVTLAMRLRVVAPVPDDRGTIASGAAHTLGPAMLAHEREALGVVHQPRKIDQVRCRHDGKGSSRLPPSHQIPASGTTRITTPEPDKRCPARSAAHRLEGENGSGVERQMALPTY